jgi:hypothetical protein
MKLRGRIVLMVTALTFVILGSGFATKDTSIPPDLTEIKLPDIVYKDNSNKIDEMTAKKYLDPDKVRQNGGEIKFAKVMTYKDYLNQNQGMQYESNEVSTGRLVFVSQIYYADGFKHPRAGKIANCLKTTVTDAETGEILEGGYVNINKVDGKKFY